MLGLSVHFVLAYAHGSGAGHFWIGIICFILFALAINGFFVVQPNEALALIFFGTYVGSVRTSGFSWSNPFTVKKHVLLRIRNFNGDKLKVNDSHGNPI